MNVNQNHVDRRSFLAKAVATGATLAAAPAISRAADAKRSAYEFIAFEKYLQPLSYEELADAVAELGFDGIEATVRKDGHVLPERVEDDLPKLVEALAKRSLPVRIMTTDVLDAEDPVNQRVLKTAAGLGITTYRMGFYTYDKKRPILEQLDELRPQVKDLAELNRELGLSAVYQNHSDAKFVGATLWDWQSLIKDLSPDLMGCAFDIRHTTVEAGLSWPTMYRLMQPYIRAVFVKDFQWDGNKAAHVPLGAGRVNRSFFDMLRKDAYTGPVSVHVEYLPVEGVQANLAALKRDFATLRTWLDV